MNEAFRNRTLWRPPVTEPPTTCCISVLFKPLCPSF